MRKKIKSCIVFSLFSSDLLASVSVVYNLRIAETTRRPVFEEYENAPSHAVLTPFNQLRNKGDGTHELVTGSMATLAYVPSSFYLRTDFAFARVRSELQGASFSRIQTDDLLFSGGYSHKIGERIRMTLSGYLGIPTHKDVNLEGIQFGYAHVGLGSQIDASYAYTPDLNNVLRAAARYIYFFKRKTQFDCIHYNFNLGNVADLFILLNSRFGNHRIEGGYNPSFFFGSHIKQNYDDTVNKTNYIRNSFFTSYKYRFSIHEQPSSFTLALSYGFDLLPKKTGRKQILTTWASWSVHF